MPQTSTSARPQPSGPAQLAYHRIRALIVAGRLSPGARLVETTLADRLGVSRGTIRPALLRLRQEGFATAPGARRQARLVVAPLTRDDAVDLYSLVGELEGLAASRAALSGDDVHRPMLASMTALQLQLEHLIRRPDPDPATFLDLDREFHGAYVAAAGRPRLLAAHQALRPQMERYALFYSANLGEELSEALSEHGDIITGLAKKDPSASREAVRRNWSSGADRLTMLIERVGARGDWLD